MKVNTTAKGRLLYNIVAKTSSVVEAVEHPRY